jgi:hypothetical protein
MKGLLQQQQWTSGVVQKAVLASLKAEYVPSTLELENGDQVIFSWVKSYDARQRRVLRPGHRVERFIFN